jgi:hypothetical protein
MEKDCNYLFRRAGEEREAARKSASRIVRDRHLEFANAYDHRGREVEALERDLIIPAMPLA